MKKRIQYKSYLEQVLRERAAAHEQAALVFVAQWEFDSRLIAQALQSIAINFPHYSLHDASHSSRIISYIGQMLGKRRVNLLSSATIWMLMSAAYYHDIGMVLTDDEGREFWQNPAFKEFLCEAQADPKHALHAEAKLLHVSPDMQTGEFWPFEIRRALTVVIAEYGRRHHAKRVEPAIMSPSDLGIDSPRARLILPPRVWLMLSRVCQAHGESFEQMMEIDGEANGVVAHDNFHPRFVAAMLRLGDLLDLDNGRFCPTMALSMGRVPHMSRVHHDKHASIRHFLVRPERIEVRAFCENREVYDETRRWLEMLKKELADQGSNWSQIAPRTDFGTLPSAGPPFRVDLPDSFISVGSDISAPMLTMASLEALRLFRDAGIYSNPERDFVRELLQNAFDATVSRLTEEGFKFDEVSTNQERLREIREELERRGLSVKVTISRVPAEQDDNSSRWRLSVEDHGLGISQDEIKYIRTVGVSSKKPSGRPEWLWSSGEYGIGLQSVFYIQTDRITIHSHDMRSRFACKLELHRDGRFYALKWDDAPKYDYGTRVTIDFDLPRVPQRIAGGRRGARTRELLREYDLVSDSEVPYDALSLLEAAEVYAEGSVVPVNVCVEERWSADNQAEPPRLYSSNVAIRHLEPAPKENHSNLRFWYRGLSLQSEALSNYHYRWSAWVRADLDLYYGRSSELLTLGRDRFRRGNRSQDLEREWRIAVAVAEHMEYVIHDNEDDAEASAVYCLVAHLMKRAADTNEGGDTAWAKRAAEVCDAIIETIERRDPAWRERVAIAESLTLADVHREAYIWVPDAIPDGKWLIACSRPQGDISGVEPFKHILHIYALYASRFCERWGEPPGRELFRLSQASTPAAGVCDMKLVFKWLLNFPNPSAVGFRVQVPLSQDFLALAIDPSSETWARVVGNASGLVPTGLRGVLPARLETDESKEKIIVSTPSLRQYVHWVHEHRAHQELDVADIAEAAGKLLEEFYSFIEEQLNPSVEIFNLEMAKNELACLI